MGRQDERNMQPLIDKVHALDTRIRLLAEVPGASQFYAEIEKIKADITGLRDRIILATMTSSPNDSSVDQLGGGHNPSDESPSIEEWPGEEDSP